MSVQAIEIVSEIVSGGLTVDCHRPGGHSYVSDDVPSRGDQNHQQDDFG